MQKLSVGLFCLEVEYSYRGIDGTYVKDYFKIRTHVVWNTKYLFIGNHYKLGKRNLTRAKITLAFYLIFCSRNKIVSHNTKLLLLVYRQDQWLNTVALPIRNKHTKPKPQKAKTLNTLVILLLSFYSCSFTMSRSNLWNTSLASWLMRGIMYSALLLLSHSRKFRNKRYPLKKFFKKFSSPGTIQRTWKRT